MMSFAYENDKQIQS